MANELKADEINALTRQSGVVGSGMAPLTDQAVAISDPCHSQHLRREIQTDQPWPVQTTLIGPSVQPTGKRLGADANGTTQIQNLAGGIAEKRFHHRMDRIAESRLSLERLQRFLRPNSQGHRIGGLLSLRCRLPAEVALLIGMETRLVVGGRNQALGATLLQKGNGRLPQFRPSLPPRDAVALSRPDDQLSCLKKQGATQQADADQPFNPAAEPPTGISPLGSGSRPTHGEKRQDRNGCE